MALTIADQSVFRLPIVSLGKCSATVHVYILHFSRYQFYDVNIL